MEYVLGTTVRALLEREDPLREDFFFVFEGLEPPREVVFRVVDMGKRSYQIFKTESN